MAYSLARTMTTCASARGSGLQAAIQAGVKAWLLIVTDGRDGLLHRSS